MKILIFGDCSSWNLPKFDAENLRSDLANKIARADLMIYNATTSDYGAALLSLEELREVCRSIPANKRSLLLLHAGKESKWQADELGLDLQALSELNFDLKVIHHMHQHVESGFEHQNLFILGHFVFCRPERLQRDRTSAYLEVDIGDDVRAELHRFTVNEVCDYDGADTP